MTRSIPCLVYSPNPKEPTLRPSQSQSKDLSHILCFIPFFRRTLKLQEIPKKPKVYAQKKLPKSTQGVQKMIRCKVCNKAFATRSAKQYHKSKFNFGEGCNIPDVKGRPKYPEDVRIARRRASRRAYQLKEKQKKMELSQ